jgi:hypothetical protein
VLRPDGARSLIQEIQGEAFGRLSGSVEVAFRRRSEQLLAESRVIELLHKGKPAFNETARFRDVQVPQLGGDVAAIAGSYALLLSGSAPGSNGRAHRAFMRHDEFRVWALGRGSGRSPAVPG